MADVRKHIPPGNLPSMYEQLPVISVKMDEENFLTWRQLVKVAVCNHGLEGFLTEEVNPHQQMIPDATGISMHLNPAFDAWRRQDCRIAGWLLSSLSESALILVIGLRTTREIWKALDASFASRSIDSVFESNFSLPISHPFKQQTGGNCKRSNTTPQQYYDKTPETQQDDGRWEQDDGPSPPCCWYSEDLVYLDVESEYGVGDPEQMNQFYGSPGEIDYQALVNDDGWNQNDNWMPWSSRNEEGESNWSSGDQLVLEASYEQWMNPVDMENPHSEEVCLEEELIHEHFTKPDLEESIGEEAAGWCEAVRQQPHSDGPSSSTKLIKLETLLDLDDMVTIKMHLNPLPSDVEPSQEEREEEKTQKGIDEMVELAEVEEHAEDQRALVKRPQSAKKIRPSQPTPLLRELIPPPWEEDQKGRRRSRGRKTRIGKVLHQFSLRDLKFVEFRTGIGCAPVNLAPEVRECLRIFGRPLQMDLTKWSDRSEMCNKLQVDRHHSRTPACKATQSRGMRVDDPTPRSRQVLLDYNPLGQEDTAAMKKRRHVHLDCWITHTWRAVVTHRLLHLNILLLLRNFGGRNLNIFGFSKPNEHEEATPLAKQIPPKPPDLPLSR